MRTHSHHIAPYTIPARVGAHTTPTRRVPVLAGIGYLAGCAAEYVLLDSIKTDPERFQNRKNAFSEASADSVARNYNRNKFDPIVVWRDPKDGKTYVLSGHSRYEGLTRRGESEIAVRYFTGTEAEAIRFSKVDANRAATPETLVEDIQAYRLMRDGDEGRNLQKATKKELKDAFRGRDTKLEAFSYLTPNGKFITALSSSDRTQFPHLDTRARWTGDLRKKNPGTFTDVHERDVFDWIYSENGGLSLVRDDFEKVVKDRLSLGKDRLFPECENGVCKVVKDTKEIFAEQRDRQLYQQLNATQRNLDILNTRFNTPEMVSRVHTDPEKEILRKMYETESAKLKQLQEELGKESPQAALFGIRGMGVRGVGIAGIGSNYSLELGACTSACPQSMAWLKSHADACIQKTTRDWQVSWKHQQGRTIDIIAEIQSTFKDAPEQTEKFAKHLKAETFENTLFNVWYFVRAFIKYKVDPPGVQYIKTPARTWQDKFGDCKSYSIMIASILANLGIKSAFRFVSYNAGGDFTHVYVIVPTNQTSPNLQDGYYSLDACLPQFNDEKPFTKKEDKMTMIARVSGVGHIAAVGQTDELSTILDGLEAGTISEGELELRMAKAQLEAQQSQLNGLYGIGNAPGERVQDFKELLEDAIDARGDQATLDAIEAEYLAGHYNTTGALAGIGNLDPVKRGTLRRGLRLARRRRIKRACNCRKMQQDPNQARAGMLMDAKQAAPELRPLLTRQAQNLDVAGIVAGMYGVDDNDFDDDFDFDEIGIGSRKKRRKARRSRRKARRKKKGGGILKRAARGIKKGAKKTAKFVKNTAKKTAKAIQRGLTTPIRLALEGMLRTRAANWFLYTFMTDAQAAKAPKKVQDKRRKQMRLAKFITKTTTMKESHFKKLLRIGIKRTNKGREPEQIIQGMMAGRRVSGIGAFPVAAVGPIIKVVQQIASFFKKKGPKPDAKDGADASDWGVEGAGFDPAELDNNPGQTYPTGLMDNDTGGGFNDFDGPGGNQPGGGVGAGTPKWLLPAGIAVAAGAFFLLKK